MDEIFGKSNASEDITDAYYVAKPVLAPDVSEILEHLGTERGGDGPNPRPGKSKKAA